MNVQRDIGFVVSFSSKIGHPLEEIRVRALKNIIQKLELGLVNESQLAADGQLLKGLIKWFNFDNYPNAEEALSLLLKLCKHPQARLQLSRLGAVDFFSTLRQDISIELQPIVDEILENFFLLTDINVLNPDDPNVDDNDANKPSEKGDHGVKVLVITPIPEQQVDSNRGVHDVDDNIIISSTSSSASEKEYSGFRLISLKWVSVSETDLGILQSTNSSIKSNDNELILNACNFLTDVVLRDFPPEVFLQYSSTIRDLLELMVRQTNVEPARLNLHIIKCVSCLTRSLLARVNFFRDAVMYNTKRDPYASSEPSSSQSNGSLESRPSVIGQSATRPRGDGQDGEASSSGDNAASGSNSTSLMNRSLEISIPHFCLLVVQHSATLLHLANPQIMLAAVELLDSAVDLLRECLLRTIWRDPSIIAQEVSRKLLECFDVLGSVIVRKHQKYTTCDPSMGNTFKVHLAAARCAATTMTALLTISVQPSQISTIGLSNVSMIALSLITIDYIFSNAYPQIHGVLMDYFKHAETDHYQALLEVDRGNLALQSAVSFVNMIKEGNFESIDLIRFSHEALPAICYYHYWEFITRFFEYISHLCKSGNFSSSTKLNEVLLKLLAYPDEKTKTIVYKTCHEAVKVCLGVQQAVKTTDINCSEIVFIFNTEIIKSLIKNGLASSVEEIKNASHEILLIILNGKMLMTTELWESFLISLRPIFPVLQAYTETTKTPLGLTLFRFVDTTNRDWNMDELFKLNIRLLFSKDSRLRLQVIPRLVWFLAKEEDALQKLPTISKLDASPLADLFLEHSRSSTTSTLLPTSTSYHVSTIRQLLELFINETEQVSTRKTAGHQLAFLINDDASCSVFQSIDGVKRVMNVLQTSLTNTADLQLYGGLSNNVQMIPGAIELLRQSMFRNSHIIHQISSNTSIYYSLLRALLIFVDDPEVTRNAIEILCFLLFQDVCKFNTNDQVVSHYAAIAERYNLPFNVHVTNDNDNTMNVDIVKEVSQAEPQITNLLKTYCRFIWNSTMIGGWEELIKTDTFQESERFSLDKVDRHLLKASRHKSNIRTHFEDIMRATSHKDVLVSLKFLSIEIIVIPKNHLNYSQFLDITVLDQVFSKFLKIHPKSSADKTLVRHILQFFTFVLAQQRSHDNDLIAWMYEQINLKDGAIYHFLRHPHDTQLDTDPSVYSPLTKELVTFSIALLSSTDYCNETNLKYDRIQRAIYGMIHFVLQHLNLAEAPQFYNLASLEAVLQCLVHITARQGFSLQRTTSVGKTICRQLTNLLMEVVAAFHLSRENSTHSFMGRGVTVAATVSLGHIASETRSLSTGDDWIKDWFYILENSEGSSQLELGWLIPLWTHTDPEVRAASLSIVVSFTETKDGCRLVSDNIQQVAGGLWGVALSFLLEHSEACIVREQAALLLARLTVHSTAQNSTPLMDHSAILNLLQNSNFAKEMAVILLNYTPHPYLQSYIQNKTTRPVPANLSTSCTLIATDFGIANLSLNSLGIRQTNDHSESSTSQRTSEESSLVRNDEAKLFTLATPALVSAICLLFQNLTIMSPQEIIKLMRRETIFEYLLRILDESKPLVTSDYIPANIKSELLDMHTNVFQLLGTCSVQDTWLRTYMQKNQRILIELYSYLGLSNPDPCQKSLQELHRCVYTLTILLGLELSENNAMKLVETLTKKLPDVVRNLSSVLSPDTPEKLRITALLWLSRILSSLSTRITKLLDDKMTDVRNNTSTEYGTIIFNLLLKSHGRISVALGKIEDPTTRLICEAIGVVLAVSESAKYSGLEYKFHETIIERIRKGFSRMEITTTDYNKINFKTKNAHHIDDVMQHMNILTNFLYQNHKGKIASNKSGICSVLSEYWPQIFANKTTILPATLSLLCTFTANYPTGSKSLAFNKTHPTVNTNVIILHEIIKICQTQLTRPDKSTKNEEDILDKLFALLATVSLVPICRSIICKQSKFIQHFPAFNARKSNGVNRGFQKDISVFVLPMWLQLFVNITFKAEGQDIVLNFPDSLETLLDLIENGNEQMREASLIVLRNLCFLSAGKTKLLGNAKFLTMMKSLALEDVNERSRITAAISLWALTANNQKGKLVLKGDRFVDRLEDTTEIMGNQGELDFIPAKTLNVLVTILSLLKNVKES